MSHLPPPHAKRLIDKLHQALPLRARVRAELIDVSSTRIATQNNSLRCMVTHVYYADEAVGPMCQIDLDGEAFGSTPCVLPIAHLKFERGHAIARDIATYRRYRLEGLFATNASRSRGRTRLSARMTTPEA